MRFTPNMVSVLTIVTPVNSLANLETKKISTIKQRQILKSLYKTWRTLKSEETLNLRTRIGQFVRLLNKVESLLSILSAVQKFSVIRFSNWLKTLNVLIASPR